MPRISVALLFTLGLSCLASCASSGGNRGKNADGTAYRLLANQNADTPIGITLSEINIAIEEWNSIVLGGRTPEDARKGELLEGTIMRKVREKYEDISDQLSTGPLVNRSIAATAIGFSDMDRALPALLAALEDPSLQVRSNALLGLGQLKRADTPLGGVVALLRDSYDQRVRSHAARVLHRVLEEGSPQEEFRVLALQAVRHGLGDSSADVRSYCALMIARLADVDSVEHLKLLIYDETPIAALAAARALAFIGNKDPHQFGGCARALTAALDKVDGTVRTRLLAYLQQLSKKNYGRDSEDWIEWAGRLP